MSQNLEQFARYLISLGPDGSPATFPGIPNEMLCLAFDPETLNLVELHILPESDSFNEDQQRSFTDRAWMAGSLHSPCCSKILDVGCHNGLHYYTTQISDSEPITSYVKRNGPLDTALTLALTIQLTDIIFQMQSKARLLQGLNLGRLQVVSNHNSQLALQISDCSLASCENQTAVSIKPKKLISGIAQILYFLLTAKAYQPKGSDQQLAELDTLPTNVKFILKHTLGAASANGPSSLAQFRKELREAYSAVSPKITKGSRFQAPPVAKRQLPKFRLKQKLFPKLDLSQTFAGQYQLAETSEDDHHCYTYSASFELDQEPCETRIQILPRTHTWPALDFRKLQQDLAKIDPAQHAYLLPVREIQESDEAVLIVEQPTIGFSLPDFLSLRHNKLDAVESVILLNYLRHAVNQANEARIPILGLSIHSIQLHFPQETQFRVRELQKRRIDHWPKFLLKLRCFPTTEGIIAAPPAGRIESGMNREKCPSAQGVLYKNFIAIAEQLVLGTHFEHGSIPDESLFLALNSLRKFLQENYNAVNDCVVTFDLHAFLEQLAELLDSLQLSQTGEIETITDGAVGLSLPAKNRPAPQESIRETQLPGPLNSNGPALIGDLNPIAQAASEPQALPGVIDDGEFNEPQAQPTTQTLEAPPKKRSWFKR
ncbi:MAG: hypothetical protein L3J39_16120 [Verrucomicrobiales bacterium]|nr:hypothetical protein [Verrucomicrobiales bacterium]